MRRLLAVVLLAALGCADGEERGARAQPTADASALDPAEVDDCVECHTEQKEAWAKASSHSLLLYCTTCHAELAEEPAEGHAEIPACARCHSEQAHPVGASCTSCHDPHGSGNAFLFRENLTLPDGKSASVHLTLPEGASDGGLVHDGAGACEVCHAKTTHYDSLGQGTAHFTSWCPECHTHAGGFSPNL